MEDNYDVTGLFDKLKAMAVGTGVVQHPHLRASHVMRRLHAINQGPSEAVINYDGRFIILVDVVKSQLGIISLPKLALEHDNGDANGAFEKTLAMICLTGADKSRFGKMIAELGNSYINQKDNYPPTITSALKLLQNYQDETARASNSGTSGAEGASSFAQKGKKKDLSKIRCFKCNKLGHCKKDCPELGRTHVEVGEDSSSDEGEASYL